LIGGCGGSSKRKRARSIREGLQAVAPKPLRMALGVGSLKQAKILMDAGMKTTDRQKYNGATAIYFTAGSDNPDVVQFVKDQGGQLNAPNKVWSDAAASRPPGTLGEGGRKVASFGREVTQVATPFTVPESWYPAGIVFSSCSSCGYPNREACHG
jgi:hypothetical protein